MIATSQYTISRILKRRRPYADSPLSVALQLPQRRFIRRPRPFHPYDVHFYSYYKRSFSTDPSHHDSNNHPEIVKTPIAIVGGGPSGLFLSNLLSHYRVPSILVDQLSVEERCQHPQAHFLNTRSMELLRQFPSIYLATKQEITPVDHWNHFQFGYNMLASTSLARVKHPVDQPLMAGQDANGTLVENENSDKNDDNNLNKARPLSQESVGHLAQHTFCKILYEGAVQQAQKLNENNSNSNSNHMTTQLLYERRVKTIENADRGMFHIHLYHSHNNNDNTRDRLTKIIETPVCIAADGAHSISRQAWNIPQTGQVGIQHLLNIHVTCDSSWAMEHLHQNGTNFAMLYSTFHPQIVSMMVCHSVGEYVLQVPFFPPYQALEDYTGDNNHVVKQMVAAAMGLDEDDGIPEESQLKIVSVKSWTMSSLIADQYYYTSGSDKKSDNNGGIGFLVGDAAHVFPPAGGLGMNTGLQDVYALAWKLAWAYHKGYLLDIKNHKATTTPTDSTDQTRTNQKKILISIGQSYQHERRPVAQANAALSVRNYHRLLEITKACYLHEQHPQLLVQGLDSSFFLPIEARRTMFQKLYQTATWTLSPLKDLSHPYTRHLQRNIRAILAKGGGLPLLFPTAELGFAYPTPDPEVTDSVANYETISHPQDDTLAFEPTIQPGRLFPHIALSCDSVTKERFPQLKPILQTKKVTEDEIFISTSDLPAQLSRDGRPCFVLLVVAGASGEAKQHDVQVFPASAESASQTLGTKVQVVLANPSSTDDSANTDRCAGESTNILVLREKGDTYCSLLEAHHETAWLIRPDGHVAARLTHPKSSEVTQEQLTEDIVASAGYALLGIQDNA